MLRSPAYIKCLKGLPLAIAEAGERHLFKAFETLFILKAVCPDRPFTCTGSNIAHIAALSGRSEKTIERRLDQLARAGLLERTGRKGLVCTPISWDKIRERYGIKHSHHYHIRFVEGVPIEYILKAKVFQDKEAHCKKGFIAQIEGNRIRKEVIEGVSGDAYSDTVAKHQLDCFYSEGRKFQQDEAYALSTNYYHRDKKEKMLRGDMAINYGTIKRIFGYSGNGSVAKMKRCLQEKGVISVTKRVLNLPKHTITTTAARTTRLGFVKFNEDIRELQLIMPDSITITPNVDIKRLHEGRKVILAALAGGSESKSEGGAPQCN